MLSKARRYCFAGFLVFSFLLGFVSCGSPNTVYVCPDGSQQNTPCPTPNPTTNPVQGTSGTTTPVNPTTQGHPIPSNSTDPPYTTPNGTVICSGDVSVKEPNGNIHNPDNDPTTGEEVAITDNGYTIIFTNPASCMQYPMLSASQINSILANI